MTLLQQYLAINQLSQLIHKLLDIWNEETKNDALWEYYMHKVYDKSFSEFMREVNGEDELESADMDEIETTVKKSEELLEQFNGMNIEL